MEALLLAHRGQVPTVAPDAFVAAGATLVGDVRVGSESSIWFGSVLRGDVCHVRIGARTNLQDGTIVHVTAGESSTADRLPSPRSRGLSSPARAVVRRRARPTGW